MEPGEDQTDRAISAQDSQQLYNDDSNNLQILLTLLVFNEVQRFTVVVDNRKVTLIQTMMLPKLKCMVKKTDMTRRSSILYQE